MEVVTPIPGSAIPDIAALRSQRVEETDEQAVREWHREHPGLVVGAFEDDELVGFATGDAGYGECAHLNGIGVLASHMRDGIGSALLDRFEREAASAGFPCVSLGSAGGYVDEFYLANGYAPESILVRVDPETGPGPDAELGHEIVDDRVDEGVQKLYVGVDGHSHEYLETIRADFGDPEAVYIMRKSL